MVFGLFSKDRALKRAMEKASSLHAQSPDRWAAMEKLRAAGTDEALFALCRRFSFRYDKSVEDQNEKDWVVQTLISMGDKAIAPITRYMKSADSLGYPLKVLASIVTGDRALALIDDILATEEPGYTRNPKRRIDVIEWLADWDGASDEQIAGRLIPYLADFDENVRFKSVDALDHKPDQSAAGPLVDALVREDEESRRLKQRIAEVLADHAFDLKARKGALSALLDGELSNFKLHRDKLQRKT